MSDEQPVQLGTAVWHDLTVPNAEEVRDFYAAVVGWTTSAVPMDGYDDYVMLAGEAGAGGICHARGVNGELPPQWLMYVTVPDLDASIATCVSLGGTIISGPTGEAPQRYAVIRDPAGAHIALMG